MTSPQTEDGFTRIANEVMEKIYEAPLSGTELRICLYVIRKTWGWKKIEDKISFSQIEKDLKLSRKMVGETLRKLVTKKLLLRTSGGINTLKFNKHYEEWLVTKRELGSYEKVTHIVTKTLLEVVTKTEPTKEKVKETLTKETNTNVLAGFGNPDLNEGMRLLKENGGGTKTRLNRFALHRLIKKQGKDRVFQAFRLGVQIRGQPYAPVIKNYLDLEEKWISLEAFIQRQNAGIGGNVYDATAIS